ncbi:MAG: hypothetical protein BM564_02850 [Bacteroidetes bacterium MedPE-SWsnd-G2]|nr:MAG: hypothetical protein BM564_02850 [Bacteroidetes bacterium MedPE-SWsnd-G2]
MKAKRIIVIGGLSAGPSAAAKARRTDENAEILLFEKTSHISYATCGIPYAISGEIKDKEQLLVVKPDLLRDRFKIDLHLNEPVQAIDTTAKTVTTPLGSYSYDKLIYATGGTAFTPPIPGLNTYKNWAHAKTLTDFEKIIDSEAFKTAEHITVVGAGLIGLETVENIRKIGKKVTVVELADQILTPWDKKFSDFGKHILEDEGVDLRLETQINAITEDGQLELSDGSTLSTSFLIMSIGVRPNTKLLQDEGIATVKNGAIVVNDKMETSIADVYAAGDCAAMPHGITNESAWFPMGTHSNKAGRAAGANAAGGDFTFSGGYGTAIMKLFNYTIARTGMGIKELTAKGIDFKSSLTITGSHPGFMKTGKDIFIELYYDAKTAVVLGAELIGEKGVDKRADVLATAIYAKLTIHDLSNLDLAYAPPFSPAKDPVVVAGFVAQNFANGTLGNVRPNQISENSDAIFIDLRNANEIENTQLITAETKHIPLGELRQRLDELDPTKNYVVYCAKGLRGYLGALILKHNGFHSVKNLDGGFTAWHHMN